jgi:Na+/melibiose symporter-like transporter
MFFATVAQFANGLLNPNAYKAFSATVSVFIVIVLFSSAWFTRDRIKLLPQPPPGAKPFSARDFYGDLLRAFRNRNYLWLMIALFSLSMMLGLRGGMGTYMYIYYWELTAEDIGTLIFAGSMLGYITGFFFSTRIHDLFDKRATIVATAATLSVFPAMPVILRMLGVFPENGSVYLMWCIAAFGALGAGSGSILNISVMSALADIADENAARYGLRQEGILYSARTFFAKLDNSMGHGLAAVALWAVAFPKNAKPGLVDADTIWWIGVIDSPLAIVPGIMAACFYAQYKINKEQYEATRRKLEAQTASAQASEASDVAE